MLQAAEFGTVNFVVPGHERLEPIHIRVAGNDINLQAVGGNGEGMGDVDGLEQELDDLAHLHREGPGLRTAVRAVRICHVETPDRKSTRLNSSHSQISYAVFCL